MTLQRVKVSSKGSREILQSPEVRKMLRERTRAIAKEAGPGMMSEVQVQKNRARGAVWTGTTEARKNEATRKSLTRALDAGR